MGKSQTGNSQISVVLRHTLEDGTAHLDWMIARADPAAELITFRVEVGVDLGRPGFVHAERIGDHRRAYLNYEGAVSGGRGRVDPIARFGVVTLIESDSVLTVVLKELDGGGRMEWTGKREDETGWKFVGVVC
jgi:hypothetical protein